jgi:hypothetical protein
MASIWSQDSSISRSSTPQVKAPCDPPPCSARSISCGGRPLPGADSVAAIGSTTPSFSAPDAYHQHDETRMVRALELDGDSEHVAAPEAVFYPASCHLHRMLSRFTHSSACRNGDRDAVAEDAQAALRSWRRLYHANGCVES